MISRSRASLIRGLSRRKNREREGLFLAEGIRVVEDLLDSRIVPRLAVVASSLGDSARGRALAERLEAACPVEQVTEAELASLAETETTQGVLIAAETPQRELDQVRVGARDVVLLLDAVQDPGNAGTLIRTADALGCVGVLALPGTVDVWNPKVVRAAAGSLFRLPVIGCDVEVVRAWARQNGITIVAADMHGTAVGAADVRGPVALAVGNEGAGLSDAVTALAGTVVAIPIRGNAESLNVAVAAGILMYELTKRLGAEGSA